MYELFETATFNLAIPKCKAARSILKLMPYDLFPMRQQIYWATNVQIHFTIYNALFR